MINFALPLISHVIVFETDLNEFVTEHFGPSLTVQMVIY